MIIVLVDTLRRDRVGAFDPGRRLTPCMDRLAREGFRFTRAVAPSSWTKPSVASLFTGLYPGRHGAVGCPTFLTGLQVLEEGFTTLAERFRAAGYRTAAFVTNPHVIPEYGFDQGFDRFVEPAGNAEALLEKGLDWIREEGRRGPFFLYLHLFDPHMPYRPPEPFRSRYGRGDPGKGALFARNGVPLGIQFFCDQYARYLRGDNGKERFRFDDRLFYAELEKSFPGIDPALVRKKIFLSFDGFEDPRLVKRSAFLQSLYDGEVAYTDAALGTFVGALQKEGVLDRAILVVTSDHGEAFLEHDLWGHGGDVHAEEVDVPLILHGRGPRGPLRGSWAGPVSLVDLGPTLLELAGLPVPPGLDGVSLGPCMVAPQVPPAPDRPVITEVFRGPEEEWAAAVSGEDKVMRSRFPGVSPAWLAYDLALDPSEKHALDPGDRPELRALRRRLEAWIRGRALELRKTGGGPALSEEQAARLRALGY